MTEKGGHKKAYLASNQRNSTLKSKLPSKTRQSIQWTPGYTIHWKPMKTILIVTKNSLIRT